jgi:hypothetical protein
MVTNRILAAVGRRIPPDLLNQPAIPNLIRVIVYENVIWSIEELHCHIVSLTEPLKDLPPTTAVQPIHVRIHLEKRDSMRKLSKFLLQWPPRI